MSAFFIYILQPRILVNFSNKSNFKHTDTTFVKAAKTRIVLPPARKYFYFSDLGTPTFTLWIVKFL